MKVLNRITCAFLSILFLSSCGVISRCRYGNGLKLNLEINVFEKDNNQPRKTRERSKPLQFKSEKTKTTEQTYGGGWNKQVFNLEHPLNSVLELKKVPGKGSKSKGTAKTFVKKQLGEAKQIIKMKAKKMLPDKPGKHYSRRPLEPHIKIGAIVFYSALIFLIIVLLANLIEIFFIIIPVFGCLLFGFIMSLIGLHKIRNSHGKYYGIGLAKNIIFLFFLIMFLSVWLYLINQSLSF